MMHSFAHHEALLNTHAAVLCNFNCIFTGCELVSASAVLPKECITNIHHVSGNLDHFLCIQNIFTIYYGTYNIKYC